MSIKKTNIDSLVSFDTDPDRDLDPTGIVIRYKKAENIAADFVVVDTPVVASGQQGTYVSEMSFPEKGEYLVAITIPGDDNYPTSEFSKTVTVLDTNLDDLAAGIEIANNKLVEVSDSLGNLDSGVLGNIGSAVSEIDAKLANLTQLVDDETDAGITSLRELLQELATSTDDNKSLLAAIDSFVKESTDDIEKMISGTDTLSDGTPNPFKGNTNVDIMNSLTSMNTFISDKLTGIKTEVLSAVESAKTEAIAAVKTVEALAQANADTLGHDVHGLAKIKAGIGELKSDLSTGLDGLDSEITTMQSALSELNTTLHAKLDGIKADTEEIKSKLGKAGTVKVSF